MKAEDLRKGLELLHPDSFGWALACCRQDPDEAEDVLQMAYLKIIAGQARFEGRASFKTWLFAVIRRTAAERRRRRLLWASWLAGRRRAVPPARPSPAPGPEESLEAAEKALMLRQALTRLSRRQQQVLHLVFYQGMTVEEAARAMDISVGSARAHYSRGKQRLRRLLPGEVSP
jgi:RNA polymerase sigma-70 factor (ECF subfamily)